MDAPGQPSTWESMYYPAKLLRVILDQKIVDRHQQLDDYSCIPMAIELVLKLLGRLKPEVFPLQTDWNNSDNRNFSHFDGRTIEGITFHHKCSEATIDRNFPPAKMKELFDTIDQELEEDRYVIVSLISGIDYAKRKVYYHNFVIYSPADDEYKAVSKSGKDTLWLSNVKEEIRRATGTDILTYEATPYQS